MASQEQTVSIADRRLRVTNLEKVLYPSTGTTKAEVIDYYTRVADVLIPSAAGRPVTRKRWPDGVTSEAFFAKALEPGAPDWVRRLPIEHSGGAKDYPLLDDVATLVYFAQVASLELHVPQWRFDRDGERGDADRLVLDLDPGAGVTLADCAVVAGWARDILAGMGLDSFPVTSGSKGIHLYAPLPPGQSSEQASALARELARQIETDHPDLVTSRMAKTERPGRIFLDWSQNNAAKTTIAPYSLRGRDEPTVAAPRTWDELADPDLRQLRLDEVLARVEDGLDPFAGADAGAPPPAATSASPASADPPEDAAPLARYRAMRSAQRTPEPVPDSPAPDGPVTSHTDPVFVVHEHHARRLHWDLRLERGGVLASWAVPKGLPQPGNGNRLAIQTEDHPLAYAGFEGEIPRGEYGAGVSTLWDEGTYRTEKWRDDEIIVTLTGRPDGPLGTARFALIRTDGRGEKSSWLVHRMAPSGAGGPTRATSTADAGAGDDRAPMLATAATRTHARSAADRWGPWVEFKWDGIRAIGVWDGTHLRLRARSGTDITARYPELTADPGLGPAPCVLDGEIVALDADSRPSFTALQSRMHLTRAREIEREAENAPVTYLLFDVLRRADDDLTGLPLRKRRPILEQIAAAPTAPIAVPPVTDDLDAAWDVVIEQGIEGVVVKNPDGRYRPGRRSEDWLKVKVVRTQDVVIGGIRPGKGGRRGGIGSLLVGVPSPDGLRYAGRVGSGLSAQTIRQLTALLDPLRTDENPFVGVPAADARDALWVRPELVAEVAFSEFTPGGILRHARWRGLRAD